MSAIDRLTSAAPIGSSTLAAGDARGLAGAAIGAIGERLLAWTGPAAGKGAQAGGGAANAGPSSAFQPDAGRLARGGDIYDLDGLARSVAGQAGATPMQEGELRRAFTDFARAAVVQVAGLSGSDRQMAAIETARATAEDGTSAHGTEGVVERLDRATASLVAANAG